MSQLSVNSFTVAVRAAFSENRRLSFGRAFGRITLGTYVHSGIYAFLVSRIDWEAQSRIAVARSGGGSGGALKAEERSKEKQSLLAGGDDEDDD